jgi:BirA family biotin operon repressor/biotin-[acetyl-CoA-carboxylase] ligase
MMQPDIDRIRRETFVARVEHHTTLASTNDRAAECAAGCAAGFAGGLPLLVIADEQTAGRGRGANRWWTGGGALAFSLLVEGESIGAAAGPAPLVALATAAAVAEAVTPLLPEHNVGLHWPNDVMVAERKLAGILIEALPDRRHIIGIGLNVNNSAAAAPAELRDRIATLRDLSGRDHAPSDLLVALLRRLEVEFRQLCAAPAEVSAKADALCLQTGHPLKLQWGNRIVTGRCRGIAPDGAVRIETAAGVESFYTGVLQPRGGDP